VKIESDRRDLGDALCKGIDQVIEFVLAKAADACQLRKIREPAKRVSFVYDPLGHGDADVIIADLIPVTLIRIIEYRTLHWLSARNGHRARGSVQEFQDQVLGFVGSALSRQFVVDVTCR
jgi:hypothetical protein